MLLSREVKRHVPRDYTQNYHLSSCGLAPMWMVVMPWTNGRK